MKKLWQKNWTLNKTIEAFETKGDLLLDQKLVSFDVWGSLAHAKGLEKIGILNKKELNDIHTGLLEIIKLNNAGKFQLTDGDEDVHTKIENYLTDNYGDLGMKIHTGRSRNDQVLTAIRLFTKYHLLDIFLSLSNIVNAFISFAKKYQSIQLPGYTHMQKAMPTTLGVWAGAFAESFLDDFILLTASYELNDQSPLGSGAGFGIPLSLPRECTAQLLGFCHVQENPLYCQNSRGKIESTVVASLIPIALTVNKFASDVLIFSTSEFGFFKISDELCSGSSIMPQKKNVDVAELLRSKVHILHAHLTQILGVSTNLMSGYHRDLQDTKKPLFESLELVRDMLVISEILIENIFINKPVLEESLSSELFATHYALNLVKDGLPFRKAYQQTSEKLSSSSFQNEAMGIKKTLKNDYVEKQLSQFTKKILQKEMFWKKEKKQFAKKISLLLTKHYQSKGGEKDGQ